jgi:hypothetical protein
MTDGVIGWQMWFVIAIDPDYADDEGLYQHELTHVKQWAAVTLATGVVLGLIYMPLILCAPSIHAALYRFVRRYRGWCEARAFAQQTKFYPDDRSVNQIFRVAEKGFADALIESVKGVTNAPESTE